MVESHKCLVVDDSPIVRRIFGIMLSRLGFAVIEAGSVQTALSLCEQSRPDLALVDWNLPDEDGVALVQQLRRLPGGEKTKLILCTVERSVTHIETALAAGADEYVTKPFGIDVLETKLGYLGFDVSARLTDPAERRRLSRLGLTGMTVAEPEETVLAAGEALFAEGDAADCAYLLLEGRIELRGSAGTGFRAPLDLIGETALTDTAPRRHGATALTDCRLVRIPRAGFQAELAQLSPFMRNWVESCGGDIETK